MYVYFPLLCNLLGNGSGGRGLPSDNPFWISECPIQIIVLRYWDAARICHAMCLVCWCFHQPSVGAVASNLFTPRHFCLTLNSPHLANQLPSSGPKRWRVILPFVYIQEKVREQDHNTQAAPWACHTTRPNRSVQSIIDLWNLQEVTKWDQLQEKGLACVRLVESWTVDADQAWMVNRQPLPLLYPSDPLAHPPPPSVLRTW